MQGTYASGQNQQDQPKAAVGTRPVKQSYTALSAGSPKGSIRLALRPGRLPCPRRGAETAPGAAARGGGGVMQIVNYRAERVGLSEVAPAPFIASAQNGQRIGRAIWMRRADSIRPAFETDG